jgi:hypothetical protein
MAPGEFTMPQNPDEQTKHNESSHLAWIDRTSTAVFSDPGVTASNTSKDQELARTVRDSLEWSVRVPDQRIRSTVSDGWVTLEGEVDTLAQRSEVDWIVANLTGVKGVVNGITVIKPKPDLLRDVLESSVNHKADSPMSDVSEIDDDFYERVRARLTERARYSPAKR